MALSISLTSPQTTYTTALTVGSTLQLLPTPSSGVKWKTSNCPCVQVSRTGLVTALAAGTAEITASRRNLRAVVTITVTPVVVEPPPSITPTAILALDAIEGLQVSVDTSGTMDDGTIVSGSIAWGDGLTTLITGIPVQSYAHPYAASGTYVLTFRVLDDDGNEGTTTLTVIVPPIPAEPPDPPDPPANISPVAVLTYVAGQYVGELYRLSTAGSFDPEGALAGGTIDWGDGSRHLVWTTPLPTEVSYTYGNPGTYTATLTLTDAQGASTVATRVLTVQGLPTTNQPPVAMLSRVLGTYAGETFRLSTTGTGDPDGNLVSWTLNRGDGSVPLSGSGVPPATVDHVYATAASYTARLTVVDDDGASTARDLAITVLAVPAPPPPGGAGNAYFDALAARADLFRAYSLRTAAQLLKPGQGGLLYSNTLWNPWTYDATFDAAKATVTEYQGVATNTLAASLTSGATTATFNGVAGDYAPGCHLLIDSESVRLTTYIDPVTKVATIVRGERGTAAASHSVGAQTFLSCNSVKNMIILPLGTTDGSIYFFTWDSLFTSSYMFSASGNNYYKAWQFDNGGTWFEPRTRFDGGESSGPQRVGYNGATHVCALDARLYNFIAAGAPADWSLTNGNQCGPGVTVTAPAQPLANPFQVLPDQWLRHFVRIDQRANDYDRVSMWAAQAGRPVTQLYNELLLSVRPTGRNPNSIAKFWVELDTSQDTITTRPNGQVMVSYHRNFVSLKNPGDVTPLLVAPA